MRALIYRIACWLSSLKFQWDRGWRDGRVPPNPIKPEYRQYVKQSDWTHYK
jgi:hypothetical protein